MSTDKSRAARACASCRRLKTRCYEARTAGAPCLRCEKLGTQCSLASERPLRHVNGIPPNFPGTAQPSNSTDARLARLEKAVGTIVSRFGIALGDDNASGLTPSGPSEAHHAEERNETRDTASAPVFVIRDLATEIGVESPDAIRSARSGAEGQDSDLIREGILSSQQASTLLAIFAEHYGRWVFVDSFSSPEDLLKETRKSQLLLSACCLIAVRHTNSDLALLLAPELFEKSKTLLSSALLSTPQTFDFFQAAVILSMWSTTVGQVPLSIDSWLLSGFAIQHCLSSDIFSEVVNGASRGTNRSMAALKLWNHLCLVHLHYSVGTRRKSVIGRGQVDRCRDILASDSATNFEMRMVAEIQLYWILYENCCLGDVDLPKAQSALQQWRQTWKLVLDQPRSQFLEMGFSFAQLLAYDQSLKARSARVRESLLSEMVRLSAAIISLAMTTADDRTKHLSDHIYHMITFAAVTLCRLLHMYDEQLARSQDIAELDALISKLVSWLKSIGLPCHAAFTLGDIVDAFHKKLRPAARPSPITSEENNAWADFPFWANFPDILGPDPMSTGNWDFIPDWEPFNDNNF
ncbi:hypothetical protein A1O7_04404 [Cladophialophora yegresii CBS 114405]|uniref:Transcriptional activator of proteases prtT n=1 Tax=Cladophialophora yegresii CBS 114405 TaxID=1182544 RepID=W9VWN6_9EURO|nr:uncharacterized protein A1O7_04404 [Cladophialophora yegresii CBS 114405]EXJ60252.1 hypothetical protein A1O7_04404 [Cladophialophora yegresii CBS 114405]